MPDETPRDEAAPPRRSYSSEDELRRDLRAWLAENLPPEWTRLTERGIVGREAFEIQREWGRRVYQGGWAIPQWSREEGGLGLPTRLYVAYLEEMLEAGTPHIRNQTAIEIFGRTLAKFGTEDQRRRLLTPMLSHDEIWCQGFTEPEAGSDLAGLSARAVRVDGGYLVSGEKLWASSAQYADQCFILVRTDASGPKHLGITLGAVSMRQPGVTVRPLRDIAGESEYNQVFFDEAFLRDEDIVGEVGQGWPTVGFALAHERGTLRAPRVMEFRKQFARLVAEHAEVRAADPAFAASFDDRLIESFLDLRVNEGLVNRIVATTAEGGELGVMPNISKLVFSVAYQDLANLGYDLHAADALLEPEYWARTMLHSRPITVYAGTSEVQRNIIAKALGLPSTRS